MSDPAVYGYGFAAAAFLAFAVHLGLGWRGGARASILLGVVIASAASAAANLAFSLTGFAVLWGVQAVLDALRAGGWLLFLCVLLQGTRAGLKAAALPIALPAAAWLFYPEGFQTSSRLAFGVLLAVPVAGLVLTEQVFRRALHQARWAVKPLCLGLGAGSCSGRYRSMRSSSAVAGVWAARGLVHASHPLSHRDVGTGNGPSTSLAVARRGVHSAFGCGLYPWRRRGRLTYATSAAAGARRSWVHLRRAAGSRGAVCPARCAPGCACSSTRISSPTATTIAMNGCASPGCCRAAIPA
jgi:hypothetical protein